MSDMITAEEAGKLLARALIALHTDRDRLAAANAALEAQVARLVGALEALRHAVCGETGFASCVRADSGKAYPWPALDEAEALVNAALADTDGLALVKALRDRAEKAEAELAHQIELRNFQVRVKLEAIADRDRLAAANAALEAQVARLVGALRPFSDVADLFDSEVEGVGAHDTLSLWLNGDDDDPAWRAANFTLGDFGAVSAALAEVQADARREGGE